MVLRKQYRYIGPQSRTKKEVLLERYDHSKFKVDSTKHIGTQLSRSNQRNSYRSQIKQNAIQNYLNLSKAAIAWPQHKKSNSGDVVSINNRQGDSTFLHTQALSKIQIVGLKKTVQRHWKMPRVTKRGSASSRYIRRRYSICRCSVMRKAVRRKRQKKICISNRREFQQLKTQSSS